MSPAFSLLFCRLALSPNPSPTGRGLCIPHRAQDFSRDTLNPAWIKDFWTGAWKRPVYKGFSAPPRRWPTGADFRVLFWRYLTGTDFSVPSGEDLFTRTSGHLFLGRRNGATNIGRAFMPDLLFILPLWGRCLAGAERASRFRNVTALPFPCTLFTLDDFSTALPSPTGRGAFACLTGRGSLECSETRVDRGFLGRYP